MINSLKDLKMRINMYIFFARQSKLVTLKTFIILISLYLYTNISDKNHIFILDTVQLSYSKYFSKIRHRGIECFYSNFSRRFQIWNQIFNIGSTFFFSD